MIYTLSFLYCGFLDEQADPHPASNVLALLHKVSEKKPSPEKEDANLATQVNLG